MSVKLENLPELQRALNEVMRVTKKTEAEIVTKAAKDVGFRAAQFIPKQDSGAAINKLKASGVLNSLAVIACNKIYGRGKWKKRHLSMEIRKILAARKRGFGALRAGWIPAIQKMGGTYRGAKLFVNGTAARGTGKPATINDLVATITNAVETKSYVGKRISGAGQILQAVSALNEAIRSVANDRLQYAEDRLKRANAAAA